MTDEFDPYKPGTGLKADFDGLIIDAVFSADPQSGNSKIVLMTVDDEGDEYPVNYWLGKDWESYDGGETVQHPKGERQLFSNQSQYSDFMVHAMEAGAKDVMYERLREGMGPRVAANWKGLKFHWDILQRPARERNEETGEWTNTTRDRLLPTKFLGVEGQQQLNVGAGTAAPAPSTTTTDPLAGIDPVTRGKVLKAAKDAEDYSKFIDAMLELNDSEGAAIMDRTEVAQAIADEAWFNTLHNS